MTTCYYCGKTVSVTETHPIWKDGDIRLACPKCYGENQTFQCKICGNGTTVLKAKEACEIRGSSDLKKKVCNRCFTEKCKTCISCHKTFLPSSVVQFSSAALFICNRCLSGSRTYAKCRSCGRVFKPDHHSDEPGITIFCQTCRARLRTCIDCHSIFLPRFGSINLTCDSCTMHRLQNPFVRFRKNDDVDAIINDPGSEI